MTTAQQIINRAAELIGYKDTEESLSGNEASNFLGILNDLVGTWNTQRLYIVATTTVSANVSSSPVSIGASQTLNTPRPIRLEGVWVRDGGIDYPIRLITSAEYDAIQNKSDTTTYPECAYYSPGLPSGSLYLWPAPASVIALHVRVMTQLSEFAALSTDYNLAPGYKRALELSLAEELFPSRVTPKLQQMADSARRAIRVANFEPVVIESTDVASQSVFNIVTGE